MFNNPIYPGGGGGGGAGAAIGGAVTGGTTGSVLFIGAGPVLAQDNANLFWDDTNNFLGIGTAAPAVSLHVASGQIAAPAGTASAPGYAIVGDLNNGIFSPGADRWSVTTAGAARFELDATGDAIFTQGISTTGSPVALTVTGAAHTTLTASIEASDVSFNLARTVEFATGALASQRAFQISAPTYGFVGASTITTAATFYINAAPVAGTNATLTNTHAIWVDAGTSRFDGQILEALGAVGAPSYSFQGDTNTGIFSSGADALELVTAGATRVAVDATGGVTITQGISTTGSPIGITFTGAAHTTLTASTEASDVNFNLARTVEFATGAIASQRAVRINAPTYGFVGASTITTAATIYIDAAPVAGTNATITNSYALWVDAGAIRLDGTVEAALGLVGTPAYSFQGDLNTGIFSPGADQISIVTAGATRIAVDATGDVTITQGVSTSGSPIGLTFTGAAHTTLAASTEARDWNINLARTVEFATGAITSQRAVAILAPTYGFVGASTITNAATLYIDAAPAAGANATITETWALWVDAGAVRFDGIVAHAAGSAAAPSMTFLSDYDTGIWSSTGNQIDITTAGTNRLSISSVAVTSASVVRTPVGSAAAPSVQGGDTNTGIWFPGVGQVAVSIDGFSYVTFATPGITANTGVPFIATTNSVTAPGFVSTGDLDTGNYSLGANNWGVTLGGVKAASWGITSGYEINQHVGTSGAPVVFKPIGAAHTTLTASAELVDIDFSLARTVQWATGALTTQRSTIVRAPTAGFVGASTITTAVTLSLPAAITAGTNATITNSYIVQLGGAVTLGPTSAGQTYAAIDVPAHTVTVTGETQVTAAPSFSACRLGIVTVTDASAVTVDTGATLYIAGAPLAAGSVTLTTPLSLWVDAGTSRFDGLIDGYNEINTFGVSGATGARVRLRYFYAASPADPPTDQADIMIIDTGAATVLRVRYNDAGAMKVGDLALI